LRGYWIVSQTEQRVEVHERDTAGQWRGETLPSGWLEGEAFALARFFAGSDIA
jgi:Uma2 family endonuclease